MTVNISNPFDYQRYIGNVSKVTPQITRVHFPSSTLLKKFYYEGDTLHGGLVRNYVVIEGEGIGFLAKIVSVTLPEKERLDLTESNFQQTDLHPVGELEIDLVFETFNNYKARKGVSQYPPVGAKVYACSPSFLQNFLKDFGSKSETQSIEDALEIAALPHDTEYRFSLSANAIFNRHCAVVGTTGGGKSWTVAKLIENLIKHDSAKVLLLDATGEFHRFKESEKTTYKTIGVDAHWHYSSLQQEDLFALFRPAGQVQLPMLQTAITSLKIVQLKGGNSTTDENGCPTTPYEGPLLEGDTTSPQVTAGLLRKQGAKKKPYLRFYNAHLQEINSSESDFEILHLATQIFSECVSEYDPEEWKGVDKKALDNCSSLALRVNSLLFNDEANSIFNFQNNLESSVSVASEVDSFLTSSQNLLVLNLEELPKETDVSSIFTNSVGRKLLAMAKSGKFKTRPLVVFIDEAHLFLNRSIKDEYSIEIQLNAFERIAKECRKYGLFLCISTQRPRDIPEGVLSQMGTFIAHRLINRFDREAIERAAPEGSRYALSFLPSLGEGEALLMGVNFPMPINLKIEKVSEEFKPDSDTPKLLCSKLTPSSFSESDTSTIDAWNQETEPNFQYEVENLVNLITKNPDSRMAWSFRSGEELIGFIDLELASNNASFGFMVNPQHRRKGYGTQMLNWLLEQSAVQTAATTIEAGVHQDNRAAQECLKKCGFDQSEEVTQDSYISFKHVIN